MHRSRPGVRAAVCVLAAFLALPACAFAKPAVKKPGAVTFAIAAPAPGDIAYADVLLKVKRPVTYYEPLFVRLKTGQQVPPSFAVYGVASPATSVYTRYPATIAGRNWAFAQVAIVNPADPRAPGFGPHPARVAIEVVSTWKSRYFVKVGKLHEANNVIATKPAFSCHFPRAWLPGERTLHESSLPAWERYSGHVGPGATGRLPSMACPTIRDPDNQEVAQPNASLSEAASGRHADGAPAFCLREPEPVAFTWGVTFHCLSALDHAVVRGRNGASIATNYDQQQTPCGQGPEGTTCSASAPAGTPFRIFGNAYGDSQSPDEQSGIPSEIDVTLADGHHDRIMKPGTALDAEGYPGPG
jgi:hypothetical protein